MWRRFAFFFLSVYFTFVVLIKRPLSDAPFNGCMFIANKRCSARAFALAHRLPLSCCLSPFLLFFGVLVDQLSRHVQLLMVVFIMIIMTHTHTNASWLRLYLCIITRSFFCRYFLWLSSFFLATAAAAFGNPFAISRTPCALSPASLFLSLSVCLSLSLSHCCHPLIRRGRKHFTANPRGLPHYPLDQFATVAHSPCPLFPSLSSLRLPTRALSFSAAAQLKQKSAAAQSANEREWAAESERGREKESAILLR